ncbi:MULTISPECIES: class I SAM-dependent methyltransferase [unclassified Tolypothrix]|uniref:class I SAM-dependent methyltransferase n=1 Tax=unclassified Tolypothrix TaxID=2649714 RepID=UPI0005EAB73E|nr:MULTISPECIES: class I SAM-dependent methyltransferase [unclassified Tolypothrix]BAY93864.1 putative methyltransferase [Microchaete diplosiphon NIES-3275]EKF03424.1 putative SAM-dependent protein [Tolypothrix sp. PCC 7601]MBE9082095.1 methyltransferase domain-containing protein [Tolypothrix sp. LEGE 11397]UYD27649.1 methyltransferase domain-containing protein [Tolypothrix sp. PCC 7712]UYD36490.1 methyltransferase domain-containing protein [Tolypothrix sp. PCC 7601]
MSSVNNLKDLLNNAELKAQPRTKWPGNLNFFPFNLSLRFQNFILKCINFLFKDQREVNLNLIMALRESVALNQQLTEEIATLRNQIDEYIDKNNNRIQNIDKQLASVDTHIKKLQDELIINDSYLKNDLIQQKRLIEMFLEESKKRLPEPFTQEQLQTFVNEEPNLLDAFYVAFEDQFRGQREEILNRLKVYLPLIVETKIGNPDFPILDVGCGRGEWLELLQESGYTARGLDINKVMVEQSRSRGFDVIEADVMLYLQSLPDHTLGAVTGFHIIEHLTFPILMKFFSEVARTLKPGGLAIFETPNPQNVLVGSCNFYFDPTHHHPLPSPLIKFMLEIQGLSQVRVIDLHPYPDTYKVSGGELAEKFNNYFYGPQDYAVVGYKL